MDFVSDALKKPKRTKRSSTGSDSVEPSAREDDLTEVIDISPADPRMRPWKPMSSSNSLERGCPISAQKRVGNENGRNEVLVYRDEGSPFAFQQSDKRFRGKEDDLTEVIDITSADPRIRPWKPMSLSNSLEKGCAISAQKRVGNENGRNEVLVYRDEGSPFPFQRSDKRFRGKEDDLTEVIDISSADPRMRPWKLMSSSNSLEKGCAISAQKRVGNENGRNEVLVYRDEGSPFPFQRSDKRFRGKEVESKGNNRQNFPVSGSSSSNRSMMRKPDEISSDLQGFSSNELNPNPSHSDKKKGKQILEDDSPNDMHHGEPTIRSTRHEINSVLHPYRAASLFEKDLVIIAKEQDFFESNQNLGWRRAHDLKSNKNQLSLSCPRNDEKNLSSSYFSEWRHGSGIEDKDHDQAFSDPVGSRRNHSWKKHVKGEKKCNSLLSNSDETLGSILNQPSISQLHSGTSNLKLEKSDKSRFHGTIIDFPDTSCGNSHGRLRVSDNFSANQIESDETFARQLQEQFYRETMGFINMEKVDETIAWSLQQDEDAKAAAIPWKDHSNSVIFDEISINFNSEVDLEMRLDFLEAMEDALENNMLESDDITSNDSFNETDYETQFNPDESIIQHVGSAEINNLPVSLIQNDNNKEECAVCLEIPSVGETIRHLPCLHKFHKMCIDAWLKRKPSCPVCKLNIS